MHPAPSLIVFTILSGFGFGLMAWLGAGFGPEGGIAALVLALLALGSASAGLLASLLHLGNPQRAWRALSQWRTSWLSREGVGAILTLGAFATHAGFWILGGVRNPTLGWAVSALALLTIFCTSMIYAQLRTVPRWHSRHTPPVFLAWGLTGPAILLGEPWAALLALMFLAGEESGYWWRGNLAGNPAAPTRESATGLGAIGSVRPFEAPHTGSNYLMKEMMFRVGRRRAGALRLVVLVVGLGAPAFLIAIAASWPPNPALWFVALACHLAGAAASRWLFFAEAEHVVGLYYPG